MPIVSEEEFKQMFGGGGEAVAAPASTEGVQTVSAEEFNQMFGGGEKLPSYANGVTPDSAINESPISFADRLKLSASDERGKMKFLKENYGDVQKTKSGDLAINHKGVWMRVDPDTFDMVDPLKLAKELSKDVADLAPMVGYGIASAAAAFFTGGASIPAQLAAQTAAAAGTGTIKGVLGKAVGTYDATPEEFARDVALDGLMGAAGHGVALAAKPATSAIKATGKKLAKLPQATKEVIKDGYGKILGPNGSRAIDTFMEYSDDVAKGIERYGGSEAGIDAAKARSMVHASEIADVAEPALSKFYSHAENNLIKKIPKDFVSAQPKIMEGFDHLFAKEGMITKVGKETIFRDLDKATIVKATGEEIASNTAHFASKGVNSPWMESREGYNLVKKVYQVFERAKKNPSVTGEAGARNLLELRKTLNGAINEARETAKQQGLKKADRFLSDLQAQVEDVIVSKFNSKVPVITNATMSGKPTLTNNPLRTLNDTYHGFKKTMEPLIQAARSGNYESLVNSVTSRAGTRVAQKSAMETTVDVIAKFGGKQGRQVATNYDQILVLDAVKHLAPWTKPGVIGQTATLGSAGALLAGNPAIAAAMGSTALISSPRVGAAVMGAGVKINAKWNQGSAAVKQQLKNLVDLNHMLKHLSPASRQALISNAQALKQAFNVALETPAIKQGAINALTQHGLDNVLQNSGQGR